jgi:hypothetical protein
VGGDPRAVITVFLFGEVCIHGLSVNLLPFYLGNAQVFFLIFCYSFIHMCIHSLGQFSPMLPSPHPLPPPPLFCLINFLLGYIHYMGNQVFSICFYFIYVYMYIHIILTIFFFCSSGFQFRALHLISRCSKPCPQPFFALVIFK